MENNALFLNRNRKKNGIDVKAPFLDKEFVKYAKSIRINEKIGHRCGTKMGKFILKENALKMRLGKEIVWRPQLLKKQGAGNINIQNF